ncbi:MAG: acyl-[ACP]--phospholipid O-acyltransferase [Cohaesibacter sp.]|nr:acyl-[ACP]--phospholipid O-acyltransferase [Cohaesibacter sp.]MCV6600812.1 acyl-[ACP]--phospholipid O-acyltransferase [Cohaesibacter sp.]
MRIHLLQSDRFAPLFWTQFLSAFNDNFLKNSLIFLILATLTTQEAASMVTLAGAIFMLPFLLFSALGGELADKYDKGRMAEKLKLFEMGAALISIVGLALSSVWVMMGALFLFGVISALFGPIKYGILPDHLEKQDLPRANAWIEAATFVAILGGTIVGGLASVGGVNIMLFGPLMMLFSLLAWHFSRSIPNTGSGDAQLHVHRNFLASTWLLLKELKSERRIWRASLIVSWFWLVGAIVLSVLPTMVKQMMGGDELAITVYLAIFALFIGLGSAVAAWLCGARIVLLPAPFGALLMAVFGFDLYVTLSGIQEPLAAANVWEFFAHALPQHVALDLAGLAFAGAFLVVPAFTAVQAWAKVDHRARVIAAVNVLNSAFMVGAGGLVAFGQAYGLTLANILLGLAVANAVVALLSLVYLPTNILRDFLLLCYRIVFRLEVEGRENLAKAGPAPILALNHVSFLDGALALALGDEDPIFAVDHTMAQRWWVRPFLSFCDFLSLDPTKPMATRTLIKAMQRGKPLVIFPEGRITVTGRLMKVYDGAAMIADKTGAKVAPIRIDGLERSYFSRLTSHFVKRKLFPKLKVKILEPVELTLEDDLSGKERRQKAGNMLYQVMSELAFRTTNTEITVLEKVIKAGKGLGFGRVACEDPLTGSLTYGRLLTGVRVLANRFSRDFADQAHVGFMLPNANGSVAVMLGLMSAGKVPAMINFTAGSANILAACKAAEVTSIVSSKAFVEQAGLEQVVADVSNAVRFVWVDEMRETFTIGDKIAGLIGRGAPKVKSKAEDAGVILFTSGSEGLPKGVVLTHRNMLANAAQAAARIDFNASDKLFNVLPMFHSFGLTVGTLLPLLSGVPVYLYPSPLHYKEIPELIYGSNATILFGTDTFLQGYARTANPFDFRSIRYCFAGAEPVKPSTRHVYMELFGLRILEGYGVTETAPILAVNTPMYSRTGSVGKLMPGVEHKLEPVPGIEKGGRLWVRGANVMAGYLRSETPGQLEPPQDGWHDTGDIVEVDEDDFVFIRGRAKRFAKIGGEMVSLAAVEALAEELWPGYLSVVASVPDARKGERLVMITDHPGAQRSAFVAFAKSRKASDLMVPSEIFHSTVPVLGSGKLDFAGAKARIEEILSED